MDIWYYLMTPFTALLKFFYGFLGSYGVALILFTLVVKLILFPVSLKGKKSMIQMNMLQGQMQKLQKQYAKDQSRYNEEVQKLYAREGVSPMGGCLWTMVPMFILIPLYAIIRRPMKYWLGLPDDAIKTVTEAVKPLIPNMSTNYPEISIVSAFHTDPSVLAAGQAVAGEAKLYGINFDFLGVDLAATPTWKFWENGFSWASIGLFLIPVLVVVTTFLSSQIMMKTNEMANPDQQNNKQNKMMMLLSPLMMVWFSFIMPAGMGLYIISNSVFSTAQEVICGRILKKDYQRAAEEMKRRELEEKEEEKRQRREKAEQRAREAEEARQNKGKKKVKGEEEAVPGIVKEHSRVGMRQYARGRAYDPERYGGVTPYHEDVAAGMLKRAEQAEAEAKAAQERPAPPEEPAAAPAEDAADLVERLQDEVEELVSDAAPDEPKEDQ